MITTTTFENVNADRRFFAAMSAAVENSTSVTIDGVDSYLTLIAPRGSQYVKVLGLKTTIETPRGDAIALEEVLGGFLYNKELTVVVLDGELDKFTVWKDTNLGGIRVRAFC